MRNIVFILLLLAAQCTAPTPKVKPVRPYFDITPFAKSLISTQAIESGSVVKTTMVNGLKEEIQVAKTDSLFWAVELHTLVIANINKPSLEGAYLVEEQVNEPNSNLLQTIYTALPNTQSKVKKLIIKYLGQPKEIRQIWVELETNNPVYATNQRIHIWLNEYNGQLKIDSLISSGFNKTIFLDSMVFSSKVVVRAN